MSEPNSILRPVNTSSPILYVYVKRLSDGRNTDGEMKRFSTRPRTEGHARPRPSATDLIEAVQEHEGARTYE